MRPLADHLVPAKPGALSSRARTTISLSPAITTGRSVVGSSPQTDPSPAPSRIRDSLIRDGASTDLLRTRPSPARALVSGASQGASTRRASPVYPATASVTRSQPATVPAEDTHAQKSPQGCCRWGASSRPGGR